MRHFWIFIIFVLALPPAAAQSVDNCPTLPSDSGLVWSYSEGPDFDVCRASVPGSDKTLLGIYLGNHPSFRPESATRIAKGKVAGRHVAWYPHDDSQSKFSRQTIVTITRKPSYAMMAHVWVFADTEQELTDRLAVLRRIKFKAP